MKRVNIVNIVGMVLMMVDAVGTGLRGVHVVVRML